MVRCFGYGRAPDAAKPAEVLGWPLESGEVMVANGGANLTVNGHSETLDLSVPRHRAWTGQSYGVDLVGLTKWGRSTGGLLPSDPSRYAIWGRTVRSPCTGRVMWARGDVRDNAVPFVPRDADPGNFVLLRCGRADVLLAHFRRGSLAVQAGQRVRKGQALAEVGNSGASSEPHLHIHAQTAGSKAAPISGRPLPVLLGGRWLVRNDRVGA